MRRGSHRAAVVHQQFADRAKWPDGCGRGILVAFGTWRSLVAHPAGGRKVASSNLAVPTDEGPHMRAFLFRMGSAQHRASPLRYAAAVPVFRPLTAASIPPMMTSIPGRIHMTGTSANPSTPGTRSTAIEALRCLWTRRPPAIMLPYKPPSSPRIITAIFIGPPRSITCTRFYRSQTAVWSASIGE
jgi:hypothetical protein